MRKTKIDQNGLTERQLKAIPFFVASSSEVEACRQAKIAKQTYYDWLKEPAFKNELRRLRNLVVEDAVEMLKIHTLKAVSVLVGLLESSNPPLQRSIANDILQHVVRFKEVQEIEERLEALEDKVDKGRTCAN